MRSSKVVAERAIHAVGEGGYERGLRFNRICRGTICFTITIIIRKQKTKGGTQKCPN